MIFVSIITEQSHLNLFANRPQPKKKRKSRTAFTNHQIFELEKRFLYQKYLSPSDRDEIAAALGLSNAQVRCSFFVFGSIYHRKKKSDFLLKGFVGFPIEEGAHFDSRSDTVTYAHSHSLTKKNSWTHLDWYSSHPFPLFSLLLSAIIGDNLVPESTCQTEARSGRTEEGC